METIKKDLKIDTRTTFKFIISLSNVDDEPLDLTGFLVKAEIRETPTSTAVLATFTVFIEEENGLISLTLDPIESAKLQTIKNTIIPEYDVLLKYPDTTVKKLVKGKILVTKTVTVF